MKGTYVTIAAKDGGSFKAYLAKPEKGSGPGIVLLQEIFGINQYIRDVADYYAEEGYVVIAPVFLAAGTLASNSMKSSSRRLSPSIRSSMSPKRSMTSSRA